MKKGIAPLLIGLIAILVLVAVEGVILSNFIFRIETSIMAAKETAIIQAINNVEFAKKSLSQAAKYSFDQAFYNTSGRGGYNEFDNVESYKCVPYWRIFSTTKFPNYKLNIESKMISIFNEYLTQIGGGITFPIFTSKIEESAGKLNLFGSGKIKYQTQTFTISDNPDMNISIGTNSLRLYNIGKAKFIDTDSVGDSIRAAITSASYTCGSPKNSVIQTITSTISDLESSLNSQYSAENINFDLKIEGEQFDPSCNSRVAAMVLVSIRDNSNSYLVYNYAAQATRPENIQLNFYVLAGNFVIQPILYPCEESECTGDVALTLPASVFTNDPVSPKASGLSTCLGKTVLFMVTSCSGNQVSSCNVELNGQGCEGSQFNAPAIAGTYTYYSCIDKNGNGNYVDSGESNSTSLIVVPSCSGYIELTLSPSSVLTGQTVTSSISGLSSCNSKTVSIRQNSCSGTQVATCTVSGPGCTATFTAPSSAGTYTYYSCIDKNSDSDYLDAGESSSSSLEICNTWPSDRDWWTETTTNWAGWGAFVIETSSDRKSGLYSIYGEGGDLRYSIFSANGYSVVNINNWDRLHFWFKDIQTGTLTVSFDAEDGAPYEKVCYLGSYSNANVWNEYDVDLDSCPDLTASTNSIMNIVFMLSTGSGGMASNIDGLFLAKTPGCSAAPPA